jgi:hypothetical protein
MVPRRTLPAVVTGDEAIWSYGVSRSLAAARCARRTPNPEPRTPNAERRTPNSITRHSLFVAVFWVVIFVKPVLSCHLRHFLGYGVRGILNGDD